MIYRPTLSHNVLVAITASKESTPRAGSTDIFDTFFQRPIKLKFDSFRLLCLASTFLRGENDMSTSKSDDLEESSLIRFSKGAFETAVAANKIVCKGILQLAVHDVRTLSDALKTGLGVVAPGIRTGQFASSDDDKKKSDALQSAGMILLRGARGSMTIAVETRSELHHLLYERMKEAVDLIGRTERSFRSSSDPNAAHVRRDNEEQSTQNKSRRTTNPVAKTNRRGSTSKSQGSNSVEKKRTRRTSRGVTAKDSSTKRTSAEKVATADQKKVDGTARQGTSKPKRLPDE